MATCNHDCGSCGESCGSRQEQTMGGFDKPNELSNVKKVIGVISGKGGVGKSLVTCMLAVHMNRRGRKVGIMDADVTGPSVPQAFGLDAHAEILDNAIYPVKSKMGISVISVNNLLQNKWDPVIWRGPVIAGVVKQFWTEVVWDDVDYLFVDMPPGTGDVPLTVFQSLPLDGILVMGTPQELVGMIVEKALRMANQMNVPVLGIIENMRSVVCPDCGKEIKLYGDSHLQQMADRYNLEILDSLPLDPNLASVVDKGMVELFEGDYLTHTADVLDQMLPV